MKSKIDVIFSLDQGIYSSECCQSFIYDDNQPNYFVKELPLFFKHFPLKLGAKITVLYFADDLLRLDGEIVDFNDPDLLDFQYRTFVRSFIGKSFTY